MRPRVKVRSSKSSFKDSMKEFYENVWMKKVDEVLARMYQDSTSGFTVEKTKGGTLLRRK